MEILIDQMGRRIALPAWPPRRIVSLVPSQTELLHDLGLGDRVVGLTKFCTRPAAWFHSKKRVGGTKTVNFEAISALAPDLIIGNKEENEREQIEFLAEKWPVWMSDVLHFDGALEMIRGIGAAVGETEKAEFLALEIAEKFAALEPPVRPVSAAYVIWRKPFMVAASGTFVDEMLKKAGFSNVFESKSRYPAVSLEDLEKARPEAILLSSEPFPFAEKHVAEFAEICPEAAVRLVDGELFSWHGSRLLVAADYFKRLRGELKIGV